MRSLYQTLGIGFVVLAAVGAVLPLMPSTPFLLLATGCFMRSSPEWNERLLRSPLFGSTLRDWQSQGIIRPRAKILALASMLCMGSLSLSLGGFSRPIAAVFIAVLLSAAAVVLSLRTTPRMDVPQLSSVD